MPSTQDAGDSAASAPPVQQASDSERAESGIQGALDWRCIGPHRGGRVVAVAGDPRDPMVFYFGACAGGVWKTTDGGVYWENLSDAHFTTAAVGAIAVADSDPNVIYAGTGESTIRGDVSHGDGIYKSTDGGKSWSNVGLQDTRHIAKIRIHPHDPDLVYVAALGHAFGPNPERGVYRSYDGGKNWERILFRSDKVGAIDLSMDPNNPRILFASLWEAQRGPYFLTSGGAGCGLYKSTDAGDTWTEITNNPGLPTGVKGKIGVAVSPIKADRVWALVEAEDGALFRSDNGGESWQRLSEEGGLRWRSWYYMHVFADPSDADTVWVLNGQCWRSIDGGANFKTVPTPHGDNHDLWIDPRNPKRMIEGNDGGACVSFNGAISWSTLYNQPTAQLYHVTTDNQIPYRIYGSQQDNSAISLPSWSIHGAISYTDWYVPGGGESGYIAVRPDDPNIVFGGAIGSGFYNGLMTRYDHRTRQERNVTVWPEIHGMSAGAKSLKYRFQWTFPIVISPHDPNTLYVGANVLLKSTNEGSSWESISPDLTRNDTTKMEASGGPITKDNTGVEIYGTIFSFVESPHERGVFWVGTDDGLVQLSRDSGRTWENVTPSDLPEWTLISILEVSPHDPATVYLAGTRYKWDDTRPYLYKTSDYGKTWQNISAGIAEHDFTRVIREDPTEPGLLYAGTETGIYVSFDGGAAWTRLKGKLPAVPIHDFQVKGNELVVATHGRSFWILNDLSALRQMVRERNLDNVRLFTPPTATRITTYGSWWGGEASEMINYLWVGPVGGGYRETLKPDGTTEKVYLDAGENPPDGVMITYHLPQKPDEDITLTFLTEDGTEIRTFTSKKKSETSSKQKSSESEQVTAQLDEGGPEGMEGELPQGLPAGQSDEDKEPRIPKEAGINRFVWNLRYPDAHKVPGDKSTEYFLQGPVVLPGQYQVQLKVKDHTSTEHFTVVQDPRVGSPDEIRAQFDLLMQIRDKVSETHDAVNQIRDLKQQIEGWEKRLKDREGAQPLVDEARALKKKLAGIEGELIQEKAESPLQFPTKLNESLAGLVFAVGYVDAAPTHQAYDVFSDVSGRVDAQLQLLKDVIDTDLASFNTHIRETETPALVPAPRPKNT